MRAPRLVDCGTLRSKLRGVAPDGVAALLPPSLVAKVSTAGAGGVFSYSEDDANATKRDVGAARFGVAFEDCDAAGLVAACAAQRASGERRYWTGPYRGDDGAWWPVPDAAILPRATALWVGGYGSTTQAHYDVADNVLGQVAGRAEIDLDSAGFWTNRLRSASSRSAAEGSGPNRSMTRTFKSG